MASAINAGKGSGADQIQDLVVAVEIAGRFAAFEQLGLVVGEQLSAQQQLLEFLARNLARANLAPDLLKLALVNEVQVEGALSDLFSRQLDHGEPLSIVLFHRCFPRTPPLVGKFR